MTESPGVLPAADRVVLVSGANRGIGRAIAERLHQDGRGASGCHGAGIAEHRLSKGSAG